MDGDFVDFDVVERSIVLVNWFSFHEVESFKSVNDLASLLGTFANTTYCLLSFDVLL